MSEGTTPLAGLHAAADAACHDGVRDLARRVDAEVWRSVSDAVEAAQAAHRRAAEDAGMAGPCPDDPEEVRERVRHHLVAVAETVHAPFLEALRSHAPVDAVAELFDDVRAETLAACRGLPPAVSVDRHTGDLVPRPYDGVGRRAGRLLARAGLALGLGQKRRSFDLRAVALRHHLLRVEMESGRWREDLLRLWGAWLTNMEASWAAWNASLRGLSAKNSADEVEASTHLWQRMGDAGEALDEGFDLLAGTPPHEAAEARLRSDVDRLSSILESDLSVAGTFLLRHPARATNRARPESRSRSLEAEAWHRWQEEALSRLEMQRALLSVFIAGERTSTELAGRLRGEVLDPWRQKVDECADTLRALGADPGAKGEVTSGLLDTLREEAERALSGLADHSPREGALEAVARRAAGLTVGAIETALRGVQETVVIHRLPPKSPPLQRPTEERHTLALQEMARQSFDALRMERVRTASSVIVPVASSIDTALAEIHEIVAFGCDAAANELADEVEGREARAREVVTEGLRRAASAVERVPEPLAEATRAAVRDVRKEMMKGFETLASRAMAHGVQGRLLDARARVVKALEGLHRRAGPGAERQLRRLRAGWLRVRRFAARLLRRGRTLIGAGSGSIPAAERTARLLAGAEEMVESLPLVYQHLFTDEAVTDPAFLAGRRTAVAEAEARWRRWREGKGIPLLVTGERGSGVTSFFNLLVMRLSGEGGTAVQHTLRERILDEEELATRLATLFDYDPVPTLDDLAARILTAPAGEAPEVVALEGLEHVYLRVPGGTDLLERLFTLMAETEPRVFWVASLTASAWQIVRKAEPVVAVQLDELPLAPLSVTGLKEAILQRHRRSGMRLHFEEPAEGRRLLRRRLRGLRGTERHQDVLQSDYFERLHRSARGNLRLAYFQWLRSVDFTESEGVLVVHPLPGLDWSFLDSLDLMQSFTIKAFLEHQTLTLAEHDEIFRCTRQESYHILDSLVNLHLIERVPESDGEDPPASRVLSDTRYRIVPLLTGAVSTHLASRNIVH